MKKSWFWNLVLLVPLRLTKSELADCLFSKSDLQCLSLDTIVLTTSVETGSICTKITLCLHYSSTCILFLTKIQSKLKGFIKNKNMFFIKSSENRNEKVRTRKLK